MSILKAFFTYLLLPSLIVGLFWVVKGFLVSTKAANPKMNLENISHYKNESLLQVEANVSKGVEFINVNFYQMDHLKIEALKIKEPDLEKLRIDTTTNDAFALKLYEQAKLYNKELNNFKDELTVLLGGQNKKISDLIQSSIEDFREQANINGWKKLNNYLGKISENINSFFSNGESQYYERSLDILKEMYNLVNNVTLPKNEKDVIHEKGLNLRNVLLEIKKYERIPKKYTAIFEKELQKINEIKKQQISYFLAEYKKGERKKNTESEQNRLADVLFSILVFLICAAVGLVNDKIEHNRIISIGTSLNYLFTPDFEVRLKNARITRNYLFKEEHHDKTLDNFLMDLEDRFYSYISTIEHMDASYTDISERLQEMKHENHELKISVEELYLELEDFRQIGIRLSHLYNNLFPEKSIDQFHKGHLVELKNKYQHLVQQNYELHIEQIKNKDFKKILLGDLAIKFQYLHKMQNMLSQKLALLDGAINKLEADLKALDGAFVPYNQSIVVDLEKNSQELAQFDLTNDPNRIEMNEVLFALKNSLGSFVEQSKISPMMERRIFLITEQLDKLYQQVKLQPEEIGLKIKNTMAVTRAIISSHIIIHGLINQLKAEGELIQKEISEIQLINSRFYAQIDLIENFKDSSAFVEQMQQTVGSPTLDHNAKERKLMDISEGDHKKIA